MSWEPKIRPPTKEESEEMQRLFKEMGITEDNLFNPNPVNLFFGGIRMRSFFKPEDFDDDNGGYGPYAERLSTIANQILQERGIPITGVRGKGPGLWGEPNLGDTHKALLVCIEELPKKECEHDPAINPLNKEQPYQIERKAMHENICAKCGVRLKAKWEVKE